MQDFGWKPEGNGDYAMPADQFLSRIGEYEATEEAKALDMRSETIIYVSRIKPKK